MSLFPSASGRRFTGLMPSAGALAALVLLFGWIAPTSNGPDAPHAHRAAFTPTVADHAFDAAMDGEQIYNTRCMSCHQMGGRGVPGTFPPLTDTDWVTGDKGRLIRLLLHGLTGPIEVDGTRYSGVMPPWGGALDDQGIADIATYIRTNFGNEASPIAAGEVAAVRAATKGRTKPWTAKELSRPANRGVPSDSTSN